MKNIRKYINNIRIVQDEYEVVEALENNEAVTRFEFGDSLSPIVFSGEYLILKPIKSNDEISEGDIVFCQLEDGILMTHMVLIKANEKFLISSTNGMIFGWSRKIYAKCESFSPRVFYDKDLDGVYSLEF